MQVDAIKAHGTNTELGELRTLGSNAVRAVGAQEGGKAAPQEKEAAAIPGELTPQKASQALKKINDAAKVTDAELRFHVDDASKQVVLEVVNKTTGEVLQEIPSELSRRLAQVLGKAAGLIVDKRA